ncbi:autophagy protein [Anaeramoeba flamelloides]|uniref:Autophagy protein 5 n=1 Tax=Anaeramoeba flamelloides TaxID=1746091 RepID=A0ABQ8XTN4_9EUKA|nr:autophagy protein [Anaeramoeba flamelloides]
MERTIAHINTENWGCYIPIIINLPSKYTTQLQTPFRPLFMSVPRSSYLYFEKEKIFNHFEPVLKELEINNKNFYLQFNSEPVRWNAPTGVFFDIVCKSTNHPEKMPMNLQINFEKVPKKFIEFENETEFFNYYASTFKESCFLLSKSATITQKITENIMANIWNGLKNLSFDEYKRSIQPLEINYNEQPSLAIRIFLNKKCIQKPIKPVNKETEELITLLDIFKILQLVENGKTVPMTYLIQGITPPLNTPLAFLSASCSHPDGFLYLIITTLN